jgi:Na+/proline symporter
VEAHRGAITLAFLVLYGAACVGVGVWALRRTRSSRDFFVAGRDLGIVVSSVAIFSTTLSGLRLRWAAPVSSTAWA